MNKEKIIIITVREMGSKKGKRLILQKTQWQNILDFFDIACEMLDPDDFRKKGGK